MISFIYLQLRKLGELNLSADLKVMGRVTLGLPFKGVRLNRHGLEVLTDDGLNIVLFELLTAEDIKIEVICLFDEVGTDVTGLNELDQSEAGLVPGAEVYDLRRPIALHIDALDQCLVEVVDDTGITDSVRIAPEDIRDGVDTPCAHIRGWRNCLYRTNE